MCVKFWHRRRRRCRSRLIHSLSHTYRTNSRHFAWTRAICCLFTFSPSKFLSQFLFFLRERHTERKCGCMCVCVRLCMRQKVWARVSDRERQTIRGALKISHNPWFVFSVSALFLKWLAATTDVINTITTIVSVTNVIPSFTHLLSSLCNLARPLLLLIH